MRQIYKCVSAVFLCFINPRGPEHFGCNATQNNIHILLLVCGASLTSPLCIGQPMARGARALGNVNYLLGATRALHYRQIYCPCRTSWGERGDLCGSQQGKGRGLPGKRGEEGGCRGQTSCARERTHTHTPCSPLPALLPAYFLIPSVSC